MYKGNIKTSKFLSFFCLIAGIVWIITVSRQITVHDDMIGAVIYLTAAVLSFILAFAFYKNFVK